MGGGGEVGKYSIIILRFYFRITRLRTINNKVPFLNLEYTDAAVL